MWKRPVIVVLNVLCVAWAAISMFLVLYVVLCYPPACGPPSPTYSRTAVGELLLMQCRSRRFCQVEVAYVVDGLPYHNRTWVRVPTLVRNPDTFRLEYLVDNLPPTVRRRDDDVFITVPKDRRLLVWYNPERPEAATVVDGDTRWLLPNVRRWLWAVFWLGAVLPTMMALVGLHR